MNQVTYNRKRTVAPATRLLAGMLLFAFSFQDAGFSASQVSADLLRPAPAIQSNAIKISPSVARVRSSYKGYTQKVVIQIQDAHTNFSAQNNLASVLEELVTSYGVSTLFVEGSSGDVSLNYLRQRASKEAREQVAKRYLASGEINGAEYLNIASDHHLKLEGVEDMALYDKSLKAYASVASKREEVLADLEEIEKRLKILKGQFYPKEIFLLDEGIRQAQEGKRDFSEAYSMLIQAAERYTIPAASYPNFFALKNLKLKESEIDFKKANQEFEGLVEELMFRSPEIAEVLSSVQSPARLKFKSNTMFQLYETLLETARRNGLDVGRYGEVVRFVEYLKVYASVDFENLLSESKFLEQAIFDKALKDEEVRRLEHFSRYLRYLKDLFSLRISREDYDALQAMRKDPYFEIPAILGAVNRTLYDLGNTDDILIYRGAIEENFPAAETFYELTLERDRKMIGRLVEEIEKSDEPVSALLTGGYHTPHLSSLLKERGISYVVVTPHVTHETNVKRYERLLLEQQPHEKNIHTLSAKTNELDSNGLILEWAAKRNGGEVPIRIEADLASFSGEAAPKSWGARLAEVSHWYSNNPYMMPRILLTRINKYKMESENRMRSIRRGFSRSEDDVDRFLESPYTKTFLKTLDEGPYESFLKVQTFLPASSETDRDRIFELVYWHRMLQIVLKVEEQLLKYLAKYAKKYPEIREIKKVDDEDYDKYNDKLDKKTENLFLSIQDHEDFYEELGNLHDGEVAYVNKHMEANKRTDSDRKRDLLFFDVHNDIVLIKMTIEYVLRSQVKALDELEKAEKPEEGPKGPTKKGARLSGRQARLAAQSPGSFDYTKFLQKGEGETLEYKRYLEFLEWVEKNDYVGQFVVTYKSPDRKDQEIQGIIYGFEKAAGFKILGYGFGVPAYRHHLLAIRTAAFGEDAGKEALARESISKEETPRFRVRLRGDIFFERQLNDDLFNYQIKVGADGKEYGVHSSPGGEEKIYRHLGQGGMALIIELPAAPGRPAYAILEPRPVVKLITELKERYDKSDQSPAHWENFKSSLLGQLWSLRSFQEQPEFLRAYNEEENPNRMSIIDSRIEPEFVGITESLIAACLQPDLDPSKPQTQRIRELTDLLLKVSERKRQVIVEPLYPYRTLGSFMSRGETDKWTLSNKLAIALPWLEDIEHLHSKEIVNRDIKPDNLLIVQKDNKTWGLMTDFGTATYSKARKNPSILSLVDSEKSPSTWVYRPAVQMTKEGKPKAGSSFTSFGADWFAAGISLYEFFLEPQYHEKITDLTKKLQAEVQKTTPPEDLKDPMKALIINGAVFVKAIQQKQEEARSDIKKEKIPEKLKELLLEMTQTPLSSINPQTVRRLRIEIEAQMQDARFEDEYKSVFRARSAVVVSSGNASQQTMVEGPALALLESPTIEVQVAKALVNYYNKKSNGQGLTPEALTRLYEDQQRLEALWERMQEEGPASNHELLKFFKPYFFALSPWEDVLVAEIAKSKKQVPTTSPSYHKDVISLTLSNLMRDTVTARVPSGARLAESLFEDDPVFVRFLAGLIWKAKGAPKNQPLEKEKADYEFAVELVQSGFPSNGSSVRDLAQAIWIAKGWPEQNKADELKDWLRAKRIVEVLIPHYQKRMIFLKENKRVSEEKMALRRELNEKGRLMDKDLKKLAGMILHGYQAKAPSTEEVKELEGLWTLLIKVRADMLHLTPGPVNKNFDDPKVAKDLSEASRRRSELLDSIAFNMLPDRKGSNPNFKDTIATLPNKSEAERLFIRTIRMGGAFADTDLMNKITPLAMYPATMFMYGDVKKEMLAKMWESYRNVERIIFLLKIYTASDEPTRLVVGETREEEAIDLKVSREAFDLAVQNGIIPQPTKPAVKGIELPDQDAKPGVKVGARLAAEAPIGLKEEALDFARVVSREVVIDGPSVEVPIFAGIKGTSAAPLRIYSYSKVTGGKVTGGDVRYNVSESNSWTRFRGSRTLVSGAILSREEILNGRRSKDVSRPVPPVGLLSVSSPKVSFDIRESVAAVSETSPILRNVPYWKKQNLNLLNSWHKFLNQDLVKTPEGSVYVLSVPLETTFDAKTGWVLTPDLEESVRILVRELEAQDVKGDLLISFTADTSLLSEKAKNRIEALLQSVEKAFGRNKVRLALSALPQDSAPVEAVLSSLDPKLKLSGISMGFDYKENGKNLDYDAERARQLKLRLFGIQMPKENEMVSTLGLFIVGTLEVQSRFVIPLELLPYVQRTKSRKLGISIFIIRPHRISAELKRFFVNLRSTETSA